MLINSVLLPTNSLPYCGVISRMKITFIILKTTIIHSSGLIVFDGILAKYSIIALIKPITKKTLRSRNITVIIVHITNNKILLTPLNLWKIESPSI